MSLKILYISKGDHLDYQDDCLSIGLKELLGENIIDVNKRYHIYKSFPASDVCQLYGKGMTVTRILDDLPIDRTDIKNKIICKQYDLIVYGSISRCQDYLPEVLQSYPRSKIFVVDGEDHDQIYKEIYDLNVIYLKRELRKAIPGVYPISFALPSTKIQKLKQKKREFSICDPRDKASYIYNNEESYYDGYSDSMLAITIKKAGWDCMRHYEIAANNCLPLFLDINKCPDLTMHAYNKKICIDINLDYYKGMRVNDLFDKHYESFINHFNNFNTTSALASYIINIYYKLNKK